MPTVLRPHNFPDILRVIEGMMERAAVPADAAARLKQEIIATQFLFFADARRSSWDDERRAKFSEAMRGQWSARGVHAPLLRYEWQEDPPRQVTQEEAAKEVGCTVAAIKMRLVRRPEGFTLRKRDHIVFFARSEEALSSLQHSEGERAGLLEPLRLSFRTKKHF